MVSVPTTAAVKIAPGSINITALPPSPSAVTTTCASLMPGASSGPKQELTQFYFIFNLLLLSRYSSLLKKSYSYLSAVPT